MGINSLYCFFRGQALQLSCLLLLLHNINMSSKFCYVLHRDSHDIVNVNIFNPPFPLIFKRIVTLTPYSRENVTVLRE